MRHHDFVDLSNPALFNDRLVRRCYYTQDGLYGISKWL
jgi:hypothetical protein